MVDVVYKIYKDRMKLEEMTVPISQIQGTLLTDIDKNEYKAGKSAFKFTKNKFGDAVGVFKHNNRHLYVTFKDGEPVHASHIDSYSARVHEIPFPHDIQSGVNQDLDNATPGSARESMRIHVENSNHPLVSDWGQSPAGHKMWSKFSREEIDRGHHVYLWDGNRLHPSTKDNIDQHLEEYYGQTKQGHRMVVSKDPIDA